MIRTRIRCLLPLLLALLVWSCNSARNEEAKGAKKGGPQVVEGYLVKPEPVDHSISVSGTLKSFEETVLMPDMPGRIVLINLPEGKFVKKGTVLVKLFDADMQASLRKLKTQLEITKQTQKRQEELLKVSGISELEYDQTKLQVNSISDDIEAMQAQISKTEVVAPYDGVIGLRNVSLGAQVTTGTALATIRETDRMKLDFSVPEKHGSAIVDGMTVSFTVQGADTSFKATVMAAEGGVEAATRNLRVRALVAAKDPALRPGTFATVEVPLSVSKNSLMVPTQCIIPQERNKRVIVARSGKATFVPVVTGFRKADLVEVVSGLQAGDTVITTGILFLRPDAPLKLSKLR